VNPISGLGIDGGKPYYVSVTQRGKEGIVPFFEVWYNSVRKSQVLQMEEYSHKQLPLAVPHDQIVDFCRRHHIRRLAFFGSVLREDFEPDSDVDVLVEFDPDHIPGLDFFAMQAELSQILNRQVDLNTLHFISPYFRGQVQAGAEVVYEQT
jgi:predicted nucleotidyltransferase